MGDSLKFSNNRWVVVTMAQPVLWPRCDQETWSLTPPNRYVINAEFCDRFKPGQISEVSDLKGSSYYKPFSGLLNVQEAKILIERHRSRGIGDLLFLTGPLSWLYHMSGGTVQFFVKTLVDRGPILAHHPAINLKTPLYGVTVYDTLPLYDYHWFIESVTEFNEDREQPNVYDALFRQMNIDPGSVEPKYKRPSVGFDSDDFKGLHNFYRAVWSERNIDLRTTPYYVVAPFSHGPIRTASYVMWLDLIKELSQKHPVIIVGSIRHSIPNSDISAGEFVQGLQALARQSSAIINTMGDIPVRSVLSIISKAACVFGLDSAPLYMAQACNVPAISLWGPHSPHVRLGYDKNYMDLAIHKRESCASSPCYAYAELPRHKCPMRDEQTFCSVLGSITVQDVMSKLSSVES